MRSAFKLETDASRLKISARSGQSQQDRQSYFADLRVPFAY